MGTRIRPETKSTKPASPLFRCPWLALLLLTTLAACDPAQIEQWNQQRPGRRSAGTESATGPPIIELQGSVNGAPVTGRTVKTVAAGGETLLIDIEFRTNRPIDRFDVAARPLWAASGSAEIPAPKIFRAMPVEVTRYPGWYIRSVPPDQRSGIRDDRLVPIAHRSSGIPGPLPNNQPVHLLVELTAPPGQPPGSYEGAVSLLDQGRSFDSIELRVDVSAFDLPPVDALTIYADLPEEYDSLDPSLRTFWLNELVRHGVSPLASTLSPTLRINVRGELELNWHRFEGLARAILEESDHPSENPQEPEARHRNRALLQIPCGPSGPIGRVLKSQEPDRADRLMTQFLRACDRFIADKPWHDRVRLALGPFDINQPAGIEQLKRFLHAAARAECTLPIHVETRGAMASTALKALAESNLDSRVQSWQTDARFANLPDDAPIISQARIDVPPFSGSLDILAADADIRAVPWIARKHNLAAIVLPNPLPAGAQSEGLSGTAARGLTDATTTSLIYSPVTGARSRPDAPFPSRRLKMLRRGMQDVAYLKLLHERDLPHIESTLLDALIHRALADAHRHYPNDPAPVGWPDDAAVWELARRIMADELESSSDRALALTGEESVMRWRSLIERTRRVDLVDEGVRVRPGPQIGRYQVECSIRIDNLRRVPLSGRLSFPRLPAGWTTDEPAVSIREIAPTASGRATLLADTAELKPGPDGVLGLPVQFEAADGQIIQSWARLTLLPADTTEQPPKIDGRFHEWSAQTATASRFASSAADSPTRSRWLESADDDPTTSAMVTRDDRNLYFAIRCKTTAPPPAGHAVGNVVDYDDLVPVGQDAVELLIDPANSGTHDPADLYHIVIQRDGGCIYERGVGTPLTIGRREPWAADLRFAVLETEDGWHAEIRIPLSAFAGTAPASAPRIGDVWGLNVTRFDRARQDHRSWSAARYNVYDPAALGNLLFR